MEFKPLPTFKLVAYFCYAIALYSICKGDTRYTEYNMLAAIFFVLLDIESRL